jgi:hypothetical protein
VAQAGAFAAVLAHCFTTAISLKYEAQLVVRAVADTSAQQHLTSRLLSFCNTIGMIVLLLLLLPCRRLCCW